MTNREDCVVPDGYDERGPYIIRNGFRTRDGRWVAKRVKIHLS